jgi:cell division protein FtsB
MSQQGFWRRLAAHKWSLTLLVVLIAGFGRIEIFGSNGYLALLHKQKDYDQEIQRLHHLQQQNRQLHHNISELKSDPAAIERIAREQLHLTRPGEVVFTYSDKNAKSTANGQ